ncbi:hypothetical protein ACVBEQ_22140 [Nakamurella sp. GG22]
MPNQLAVVLRLDGVIHAGDVAVQSFARHAAGALPADQARAVIAGMRGFLERAPGAAGPRDAEDGDQAVAVLAAAAGLPQARIEAARLASRHDLAATGWLLEPSDGLENLLASLRGALVVVLTTAPDPAAAAVLDACELTDRVDMVTEGPVTSVLPVVLERIGATTAPERLLMIGTRWVGELAAAQAAGAATGMVDRFARNLGTPTWRSAELAGLVEPARQWCAQQAAEVDRERP